MTRIRPWPLQHTIKAFITRGEDYYVAECLEIAVVTQGKTLDETVANLKEAVELHLQDEDLSELGLVPAPTLLVTMEVEPEANVAYPRGADSIPTGII
jgi:predicted RNase H-like HicB family nuclease